MALREFGFLWLEALFVTVTGQAPSDLVRWLEVPGKSLIGVLETESYSLPTICALGWLITSIGPCECCEEV